MITSPTAGSYPSIETIFQYTRIHVNDTFAGATGTVGEGRIFTDTWTPSINILNMAIQALQRDLETLGLPTTREIVKVVGISKVNGPLGSGVADPNVICYLGFDGFYDGSVLHGSPTLPLDLLVPLKIRTRVSTVNAPFKEVHEFSSGLISCNQSALGIGGWLWINDKLYFNGTLAATGIDLEVMYTGAFQQLSTTLNPDLFDTTLIPFLDSGDALAYKCAYIFCSPRLPKGGAEELQANYTLAVQNIANRWLHQPDKFQSSQSLIVPARG